MKYQNRKSEPKRKCNIYSVIYYTLCTQRSFWCSSFL